MTVGRIVSIEPPAGVEQSLNGGIPYPGTVIDEILDGVNDLPYSFSGSLTRQHRLPNQPASHVVPASVYASNGPQPL